MTRSILKGFPYKEMEKVMQKKGIRTPKREVSIVPPANVWRHLREIPNNGIKVTTQTSFWYVLGCLKAMYGLGDAPLAWQLVS